MGLLKYLAFRTSFGGQISSGWLGDHWGLRTGLCFLYLTMGYICSIGFRARPIITNKTIDLKLKG